MPASNAVTPTDSASALDFEFPAPGSEGYDEFRKTGKIPEAKPAEEEIEPKKPESSEAAESATAKPVVTRPESATGTQQGKKKGGDERFRELANKNRELLERLEALERNRTSSEERREPVASPAPEKAAKTKPKLSDNDPKTGKPFASLESWSDAVDDWNNERINGILEDRLTKAEQTRQQTEYERKVTQQTQQRCATAMQKYADFVPTVTNPKLLLPEGSAAKLFLTHPNTKNEGEIVYFLGKHPEVLEDFYSFDAKTGKFTNKTDPIEQVRYLAELDRQFSAEPEAPKPPARTITQAPRPPHQVSGKAPTPDPLAKAVEEGNQADFTRLENERILAKRKAGGRR